jgi:hypothetical protein
MRLFLVLGAFLLGLLSLAAISLLQALHAGFANLCVSTEECLDIVWLNHGAQFDLLTILRSVFGLRLAICSTH